MQDTTKLEKIDVRHGPFHLNTTNEKNRPEMSGEIENGKHVHYEYLLTFIIDACNSDAGREFLIELAKHAKYADIARYCEEECLHHEEDIVSETAVDIAANSHHLTPEMIKDMMIDIMKNGNTANTYKDVFSEHDIVKMYRKHVNRADKYIQDMVEQYNLKNTVIDAFRHSDSFEGLKNEILKDGGFNSILKKMVCTCLESEKDTLKKEQNRIIGGMA